MITVYASGSRAGKTLGVNATRNRQAMIDAEQITGMHSEPLIGCFEGVPEYSFRVSCPPHKVELLARHLANEYEQQCIMAVSGAGTAFFVDGTGTIGADVGTLTAVGLERPQQGDWSFDGQTYLVLE